MLDGVKSPALAVLVAGTILPAFADDGSAPPVPTAWSGGGDLRQDCRDVRGDRQDSREDRRGRRAEVSPS